MLGLASPVSAQTVSFDAAFVGWLQSMERLISSVAITTKQDGTAAAQQATVSRDVKKAAAESMLDTERRYAMLDAHRRFESMQTAVAGLCGDVRATTEAGQAQDARTTITNSLRDVETDWNRDGGSRTDLLVEGQIMRAQALCPPGEAALGLCDPNAADYIGGFPAGDTDPSPFLLSNDYGKRRYGNAEAEIGMIYTDTLLPLTTMKSREEAGDAGVAGLVERANARHQQAIISIGRKTLTDVILRGLEGGIAEE